MNEEKQNEETKYITVKEFAAAAGVSNKAIYQQLNTRLKDYCKVINNVKMIDKKALAAYYSDKVQALNQVSSQVESSLESQENNEEIAALKMLIEELKEEKEELKRDKEQLIKDKEDLKQDVLSWKSLFADERKKVKLLEQKEEQEAQVVEFEAAAAADEKQEQEQPTEQEQNERQELPQGFINKLKWLLKS